MPQIIAVPDINVFVSGTITFQSYPAQVIDLWRQSYYQVATSETIIEKMRQVYLRPGVVRYTKMAEGEVDKFLNDLRESAIVVPGTTVINICRDPEDNQLFSCAVEAKANYIVSGDEHVLQIGSYKGVKTLNPREFVEEILTT